ncbi:hypothetical protein BD626DRAFT_541286 [Schizophyllum amplum]|uniref:Uncharacterized protein n=1 Tax=Schizophyllum amplum TaxID=97359 RepID=A0A550BVH3_9AGAR|nr:hypothetical protein BD626DRAFT_541286 [Auriculariopsis ampla]
MASSEEQQARQDIAQDIKSLVKRLPSSIPSAEKSGKIYKIITGPQKESAWMTFNSRFDVLFGEDCRDAEGNLLNIERGRFGMDAVSNYVARTVVAQGMLHVPMMIKLERLKTALQLLVNGPLPPPPPMTTTTTSRDPANDGSLPTIPDNDNGNPSAVAPTKRRVPDEKKLAEKALRSFGVGALAEHILPPNGMPSSIEGALRV